MVILIIIGVVFLIFVIISIKHLMFMKLFKQRFEENNVIVFGRKGTGKDLIFQKVINLRKKKYFSNINYGGNYEEIKPIDLDLNNDFNNMINDTINQTNKDYRLEGNDIYFSDCGIYLPSQYDYLLNKTYKSLPIFYATSRHLYGNNIHCNTQNLERIWKGLREQADTYMHTKKTICLFGLLITKVIIYDKYDTALKEIEPIRISKQDKTEQSINESQNGLVKGGLVIQRTKKCQYDSRYFHQKFFGEKYVKPKKKKKSPPSAHHD